MSKILEMEFATDQNKTVRIQVPNAIVPVDTAKVSSVMDQLLASNALIFKTGHPVKKSSAKLLDTETTSVLAKQ